MKTTPYLILLLLIYQTGKAQNHPELYKDGYALKKYDTIKCKVMFNTKYEGVAKAVKLIINGDEGTFFADGLITGFGFEEDGKRYDYGSVNVENVVGPQRILNTFYVKKLVAGIIDYYEYSYSTTQTTRTTVNGVEKPGSATSTTKNYTINYIAKKDSTKPSLANPVIIPSYKKSDLEVYLGDNATLYEAADKRFTEKKLIAILKEYNEWSVNKKKQD